MSGDTGDLHAGWKGYEFVANKKVITVNLRKQRKTTYISTYNY